MNKLYLLSHLHDSNRFNSLAVQGICMHAELLSCPKRVLPTERNILPLTILTLTCSYPTRENSFFT